jgi:hypothetical protein
MKPGQLIHESVFDKIKKEPGYWPKARLYDGVSWKNSGELRSQFIEDDPYTKVTGILELKGSIFKIPDLRLDVFLASARSG